MKITVLRLLAPDPQQFEIHLLARHGVERAERLVHQQEPRVLHERAHDRGALLHAAGKLERIALREFAQADHREKIERALPVARDRASLRNSIGSSTFSSTVRHGSSTGD